MEKRSLKKIFLLYVFAGLFVSFGSVSGDAKIINSLSWMEVSAGAYENMILSTKILFKCSKPLTSLLR